MKYLINSKSLLARFLLGYLSLGILSPVTHAQERPKNRAGRNVNDFFLINPGGVAPVPGSEYMTADPKVQRLVSIMVVGEVNKPGVFHVAPNTSIARVVALAGGISNNASGNVKLVRNNNEKIFDVYSDGLFEIVEPGDTLIAQESFKTNLPLIFSALSATLTLATLVFVLRDKSK